MYLIVLILSFVQKIYTEQLLWYRLLAGPRNYMIHSVVPQRGSQPCGHTVEENNKCDTVTFSGPYVRQFTEEGLTHPASKVVVGSEVRPPMCHCAGFN